MTTRRVVLVSALFGVGLAIAGLWLRYGWLWEATAGILHPMRASFDLKGVVSDEQGNALENVTLSIAKLRGYPVGADPIPPDMERKAISGYFEAEASGYAGVILGFAKDGYYSERREFRPAPMSGLPGMGPPVDRNIRIVMQKKGELTKLTSCSEEVLYRGNGSGIVLDFGRLPPQPIAVEDVSHRAVLPRHGVYVTADLDPRGRIAIHTDPYENNTGYHQAQRLVVHMTDPGDGFIPFQPQPGKEPRRQMTQAPAQGYESQLVIPAQSARARRDDHNSFFYFRVGGKYGRGYLRSSVGPEDWRKQKGEAVATVRLWLFIQPDGSRNLEDDDARP
jgi:hypothetical protein